MNNLYCLVGKSGSGKTSIMQVLRNEYGYTIAESYTDRPRRNPDEEGHTFVTPKEFKSLSGLILRRDSTEGRYGMTLEMLDSSILVSLDCKGICELLKSYISRPVKVIGIYADLHSRIVSFQERGDSAKTRRARMAQDEKEFYDMEDLCDILIPNRNLDVAVALVKDFIDFCEESAWTMTDDNCFQFRRRLPDFGGAPYYELAQVNTYGDRLFSVAHGRVSLSYDMDESSLDELTKQYGWSPISILGREGGGIVAEAIFENGGTEYDLPEEYPTFEAAAKALCEKLGLNWEKYGKYAHQYEK